MRPELLSPAGDFEKLKSAIYFGADAVYLAGKAFGMRAASGNFTNEELVQAVEYAHERGVRVYVTVNIMPRDAEYPVLERYLQYLQAIGADAAIVSDLGVVALARVCAPNLEIHISTQASTVSAATCMAWHKMGARRIVLARELSLEEIAAIRTALPDEVELETFVHGSMCVAYSGRCLLSQYYVGRDANRGACAQPCRWIYSGEIAEEKRASERLPIVEDGGESFIMSSKDMCMIAHVPELVQAGINSLKLEGRVRSAYYTAVVTNTYKMALDAYMKDPAGYHFDSAWQRELDSVSHREYDTGFFFHNPKTDPNLVTQPGYIREKAYLAVAVGSADEQGRVPFVQRNKTVRGAAVEILAPGCPGRPFMADAMWDAAGAPLETAPHPGMTFLLRPPFPVQAGDVLREG
ncbi:MAG: U32 family peptidase [Clostridiales bacterium]|jgi:putative protease|nr:U32 family peptidase [Clostridiales bacterium]